MGITIKLDGLTTLMADVSKTIKEAERETKVALTTFAKNVEADAKRLAPANEGFLRNSISGTVSGTTASVVASAGYAAYLEFGTRKFAAKYVATLPADWKAYAATFKGPGGGTLDQFIQDIMQWVQQKGIGGLKTKSGNVSQSVSSLDAMQAAAYAIALNILQNGIKPHPYMYPSITKHTPALIDDIKKIFS